MNPHAVWSPELAAGDRMNAEAATQSRVEGRWVRASAAIAFALAAAGVTAVLLVELALVA